MFELFLLFLVAQGSIKKGVYFNETAVWASYGSVSVEVDGVSKNLPVIAPDGGVVNTDGNKVVLGFNARVYLGKEGVTDIGPNSYQNFKLDGLELEYTVKLGDAGCNCVAAFYMVAMPGKDSSGNYAPSHDNSYYCDANNVGGVWCPEWDISEANIHAFQSTPHKCDDADGVGHYNSCDTGGCASNVIDLGFGNQYGPGSSTIDTTKEYDFKSVFSGNSIKHTISQNGKSISFDVCGDQSYNAKFISQVPDGMAITMSFWGSDDVNWLDKNSCYGPCGNSGYVTYSNIKISHNHNPPGPTPTPASGCCSWSNCDHCGPTSDYCKNQQHCEHDCGGQWCSPGPSDFKFEQNDATSRLIPPKILKKTKRELN